jgi:hypothetical protein
MKATHRRLLIELCKAVKLDIPLDILFALGETSEKGNTKGAPKDRATKPAPP